MTQRQLPSIEKISELNLTQEDEKKDEAEKPEFYYTKGTGESVKLDIQTDSQDMKVLKTYNEETF